MMGKFPAVFNFNRLFLQLNQFICNQVPVLPDHRSVWLAFRMTLLVNKWTDVVMDDEWVSSIGQTPYLLLSSTCDEKYCCGWLKFRRIITWSVTVIATMEIDNPPHKKNLYNEWRPMLGQHLVLVTSLHCGLQSVSSETTRSGDH